MRRPIATAVPLPVGPDHGAVLSDDPSRWLPDARPQGLRWWRFTIETLGWSRPVLCEVSGPVITRSGPARRLAWAPMDQDADLLPSAAWLPGFTGQVQVVGEPSTPSVVLSGHVDVPLGVVGAALDGIGMRALAERSLDGLLRRIAAALAAAAGDAGTARARRPITSA